MLGIEELLKPGSRSAKSLIITFAIAMLAVLAMPGKSQADPDGTDPFFGVVSQRHLTDDDFDTMKWGRLGSFRLPIDWGTVEKEADGRMDWKPVDRVVRATAERGIDFMPTFYGSPRSLNENWRTLPVKNKFQIRKWKQFLTRAALRYGTDGTFWDTHPDVEYRPVHSWQVWNEPNINTFSRPVSPRNYATLLRVSAKALTNADPEAKIVLAGLYGTPPKGKGIDAGPFLNRLYRFRQTKRSFDIAAVHPYATNSRQALQRTRPVVRSMNRHRDRKTRLTITELGWGSDSATAFGTGSVDAQGKVLRNAYQLFLKNRKRLRLDSIYWFSWSDMPPEQSVCAFCQETGFFDVNNEPKPAWFEMLNFSHDL